MKEKTKKKGILLLRPCSIVAEYNCKCGNEIIVAFIRCKPCKKVECDSCGKWAKMVSRE